MDAVIFALRGELNKVIMSGAMRLFNLLKFKNIVKFLETEQAKEDSNFTIKKYGTGILVIPNIGENMASKPIWTKKQQEYLDERFNAIDKRLDVVEKRLDEIDKKFELVFKYFEMIFKHLGIENA